MHIEIDKECKCCGDTFGIYVSIDGVEVIDWVVFGYAWTTGGFRKTFNGTDKIDGQMRKFRFAAVQTGMPVRGRLQTVKSC